MPELFWVLERAGIRRTLAASVIAAAVMASPATSASGMAASGAASANASVATANGMDTVPQPEARTLELTSDAVIVRAPDGDEIQRIPFDPDALTDLNRAYFMTTPDINFDGYPDLLLIYSQGAQNIYYDGWIRNPETERYVYIPQFRTLASPVFDENARLIRTYEHGSATDHMDGVWAWRDGQLIEITRQEQTYDINTNLFTLRPYELQDDGQLALVPEETLTEAQLNAR
jgi:hypothetical protein